LPQVRARRRALEMRRQGLDADEAMILSDILRRDERDSTRPIAALRPAADAKILDTSDLDIDAVFRAAIALVEQARHPSRRRDDGPG
jgi:CMP/dCMP kinase